MLLRGLFFSLFAVYIAWNVSWLAQGRLAPSLFQTLTGFPCPTTGGTRSLVALCRGQVWESLCYNAMTVPICLLAAASIGQLGLQMVSRRQLSLSTSLVRLWAVLLLLAWILKLSGDVRYW